MQHLSWLLSSFAPLSAKIVLLLQAGRYWQCLNAFPGSGSSKRRAGVTMRLLSLFLWNVKRWSSLGGKMLKMQLPNCSAKSTVCFSTWSRTLPNSWLAWKRELSLAFCGLWTFALRIYELFSLSSTCINDTERGFYIYTGCSRLVCVVFWFLKNLIQSNDNWINYIATL